LVDPKAGAESLYLSEFVMWAPGQAGSDWFTLLVDVLPVGDVGKQDVAPSGCGWHLHCSGASSTQQLVWAGYTIHEASRLGSSQKRLRSDCAPNTEMSAVESQLF